jgi:hypothetical protein
MRTQREQVLPLPPLLLPPSLDRSATSMYAAQLLCHEYADTLVVKLLSNLLITAPE